MQQHTRPAIAIIGGGIAGCSTAFYLAQAGFSVTIFEQSNALALGASGNGAAMLYPRLNGDNIHSRFAYEAFLFSVGLYQQLQLPPNAFQQCGMLQLGFNPKETQRITQAQQNFDIGNLVDAKTASHLSNIPCKFDALHIANAGWLVPKIACQHLVSQAAIQIKLDHQLEALTLTDEGLSLKAKDHEKSLGHFSHVIHCDAFAAQGFEQTQHLGLETVRGQVSLLTPSDESRQLNKIICSDGYLSPVIDGYHHLGASFKPNSQSTVVSTEDHEANVQKLTALAPTLQPDTFTIAGGRAGLRTMTKDRLPLVGGILNTHDLGDPLPRAGLKQNTLPWHPKLWVNLAHGSHGFSFAPYCAYLLTLLITGQHTTAHLDTLAQLNPNRTFLKDLGLKRLAQTVATPALADLHFTNRS